MSISWSRLGMAASMAMLAAAFGSGGVAGGSAPLALAGLALFQICFALSWGGIVWILLGEMYPLGIFEDGIRFHNEWEGRITEGPFTGGRVFGLDQFVLRPDGIGVIDAPEVIECGDVRVTARVLGYVVPPAGLVVPPLEIVASPGFEFPSVPFRVTASAMRAGAAFGSTPSELPSR